MSASWSLAVDMGGTFIDAVALRSDGHVASLKHPRAGRRLAEPVVEALDRLCAQAGIGADDVGRVVHGSTVVTNLLLELNEPPVALVLTRGMRDVPVLARQDRKELYEPVIMPAVPEAKLFPEPLRFEIGGRIDAEGREVEPLDLSAVDAIADAVSDAGVRALAVGLLFSHRNPTHERALRAALHARLPSLHISLSSEVDPQPREFERWLTTALDAYAKPLAANYLHALADALKIRGLPPLRLMRSAGGTEPWHDLAAQPIGLAMSGPCAALQGVAAGLAASGPAIVLDIGGTSADISILLDGRPTFTDALECDGLPIRQRCADIASIGIGGGSVVSVLPGGALRLGPRSQGAWPGPAAFGLGGGLPTLSDALCVLDRLPPRLAGGIVLDRAAAEAALGGVAGALGLSVLRTAEAVVSAAAAGMAEALKTHAFQRNLDPADAVLVAIGGGGAQHAAEIAELAGIRRVLVMPNASVMSALGMLCGPEEGDVGLTASNSPWASLPPEGAGPHSLFAPMTTAFVPAGWSWRLTPDQTLALEAKA
ncbi:hydantoinase/oxoprolinase family protein [Bradyrhizobium sp. CCBAU 51765]|uniref:hydantoinase/oxoprolinase family protein n=1 Tax=Bradyrhizobium sp. CCBAU 51765 TaxID=1325102 RepID=UPI00188869F2|nr:hydantoinase/oxoprolinase family protein [Bradyrhizobium sp. CCBAU 51765]QOZ08157.1 hydantoinase/oxoprolinase family protein [Bradyrhizobium sp. CCBAU 51765]